MPPEYLRNAATESGAVIDYRDWQIPLGRLNRGGALYLTHTRVNGAYTLRLAIGGTLTERWHVEAAWRHISAAVPG